MDRAMVYEIRVEGHLNQHWTDWFCPSGKCTTFELAQVESGETVIRGDLEDQAALQGVLTKIWNLGLTLNSVVVVRKRPEEAKQYNSQAGEV